MTNDLSRGGIADVLEKTVLDQFDAPKGQQTIAQGFNPGFELPTKRPESGARTVEPRPSVATFRAHRSRCTSPGLKPRLRKAYVAAKYLIILSYKTRARHSEATAAWAKILCPFGANPDRRRPPFLST
jgi:hypothetical protein